MSLLRRLGPLHTTQCARLTSRIEGREVSTPFSVVPGKNDGQGVTGYQISSRPMEIHISTFSIGTYHKNQQNSEAGHSRPLLHPRGGFSTVLQLTSTLPATLWGTSKTVNFMVMALARRDQSGLSQIGSGKSGYVFAMAYPCGSVLAAISADQRLSLFIACPHRSRVTHSPIWASWEPGIEASCARHTTKIRVLRDQIDVVRKAHSTRIKRLPDERVDERVGEDKLHH